MIYFVCALRPLLLFLGGDANVAASSFEVHDHTALTTAGWWRRREKQCARVLDDSRACVIYMTLLLHICRDWEAAGRGVSDPGRGAASEPLRQQSFPLLGLSKSSNWAAPVLGRGSRLVCPVGGSYTKQGHHHRPGWGWDADVVRNVLDSHTAATENTSYISPSLTCIFKCNFRKMAFSFFFSLLNTAKNVFITFVRGRFFISWLRNVPLAGEMVAMHGQLRSTVTLKQQRGLKSLSFSVFFFSFENSRFTHTDFISLTQTLSCAGGINELASVVLEFSIFC